MPDSADQLLGPVEQLLACGDRARLEQALLGVASEAVGAHSARVWLRPGVQAPWEAARAFGEAAPEGPIEAALVERSADLLPSGWRLARGERVALAYAAWSEDEGFQDRVEALVALADVVAAALPAEARPDAVPPALPAGRRDGIDRSAPLSALLAPWAHLEPGLSARLEGVVGAAHGQPEVDPRDAPAPHGRPTLRLVREHPDSLEIAVDWPRAAREAVQGSDPPASEAADPGGDGVVRLNELAAALDELLIGRARVSVGDARADRLHVHLG